MFGQLSVTESGGAAPAITRSIAMIDISEKYRLKALACEQFAKDAVDTATRSAWTEIAIEWHALASRTAHETSKTTNRNLSRAAAD
jgi:hypothetical protein